MVHREHVWREYYDAFSYFSQSDIRDGCHPRKFEHEKSEKAIVLVHGLTDSPYYMKAIANYFHHELGYNVYLPLLQAHGMKTIASMKGVSLKEWEKNVSFALDYAATKVKHVSLGGLSMGATLSLHMALKTPRWNGTLYLFSAALELPGGIIGKLQLLLLRSPFLAIKKHFDKKIPLVGIHPFRYDYIDMDAARELAILIKECKNKLAAFKKNPLSFWIFTAHSEADISTSIKGVERLLRNCIKSQVYFFRIPQATEVDHASIVLQEPIFARNSLEGEPPLESANPCFNEMMQSLRIFSFSKPDTDC